MMAALLVVACNGKSTDRVHNETPKQDIDQDGVSKEKRTTLSSTDSKVWTQSINDLQQILSAKNPNAEQLLAQLVGAEKILLHEKTLNDKNYYQSTSFRDLLVQFNRGIIQLQGQSSAVLEKSGLLERYIKVLLDGCQKDQSECRHLLKFRADHLTSQVLVSRAQIMDKNKLSDTNIHDFYQTLKAALDIQAVAKNYEIESLYFKHAIAYLAYLKARNEPWAKLNEAQLKSDISMILTKLSGQYSSNELNEVEKKKYCDFISQIEPLNTSNKVQMIEDSRRKDLIKDYLLCQAGKSSLEESLVKAVKQEKEEQIKKWTAKSAEAGFFKAKGVQNFGYNAVLKALEKDHKLTQAFKLNLNHAQDGGFFIIDKLYYEKLDFNQAAKLLESVRIKSDLDFIKNVRAYSQNQTAFLINETLRLYAIIFEEAYNRLGLKDNLFREVINQVDAELFQPWFTHIRLLGDIEKLIQTQFDKKYRGGNLNDKDFTITQKEILDLRSELSNIKNHLSMVLTTPMEYALIYYMSQTQGTIKIDFKRPYYTYTFEQKADEVLGKTVMPSLYNDKLGFFEIVPSGNENRSDNLSIISLQYALKIGLFEKFPFNLIQKESKSGLELFVTQFLKETLRSKRPEYEKELKKLKDLAEDRDFRNRAQDICENPIDTRFYLKSIDEIRSGFALQDSPYKEKMKTISDSTIRAILRPNDSLYSINQLKLLIMNYLKATNGAEKAPIEKLFDNETGYIRNLQKEMAKLMLDLDNYFVNESMNCVKKLARSEAFRRKRLLEEHMEYFKNVHAAMTLLRSIKEKNIDDLAAMEEVANQQQNADVGTRMKRALKVIKDNHLWVKNGNDFQANYLSFVEAINKVYAIHNNSDLANKYGFYINEPRLNFKDGKPIELKKISFFDDAALTEGVWDSTFRTKSYLSTVSVKASELSTLFEANFQHDSPIGTALLFPQTTYNDAERLLIWDNTKKNEIPYDEKQEGFLKTAMLVFAARGGESQVYWFSSNIDMMRDRLKWLITMSMADPIAFGEQKDPNCKVDGLGRAKKTVSLRDYKKDKDCGLLKVSSKDLIHEFLQQIEFLHNTPEERALYDFLGMYGKNVERAESTFKYHNEESTSEWTYFDEFIRQYYINKEANGPYLQGMYSFTDFKQRKDAALNDKDHLLGMDDLPITLMRESLRKNILPQIEWVFKLEKAIRQMEIEHGKDKAKRLQDVVFAKSLGPRNNEVLAENSWRVLRVRERSNGTPVYLRDAELGQDSAIEWYRGYIRSSTVQKTNCEFLPQQGDSDQMTYKSTRCEDRYNEWFKTFLSEL